MMGVVSLFPLRSKSLPPSEASLLGAKPLRGLASPLRKPIWCKAPNGLASLFVFVAQLIRKVPHEWRSSFLASLGMSLPLFGLSL